MDTEERRRFDPHFSTLKCLSGPGWSATSPRPCRRRNGCGVGIDDRAVWRTALRWAVHWSRLAVDALLVPLTAQTGGQRQKAGYGNADNQDFLQILHKPSPLELGRKSCIFPMSPPSPSNSGRVRSFARTYCRWPTRGTSWKSPNPSQEIARQFANQGQGRPAFCDEQKAFAEHC